jgi:hypothetical protein
MRSTSASEAFEQAAMAMSAAVCELSMIRTSQSIAIECQAPDRGMLRAATHPEFERCSRIHTDVGGALEEIEFRGDRQLAIFVLTAPDGQGITRELRAHVIDARDVARSELTPASC